MGAHLNPVKTGIAIAAAFAGWHLSWSILVALGWAQPVIDFVFWMHFIKPVYVVEPFEVARAAVLLAVTAGLGFVIGWAFAWIWNAVHRPRGA
jgi:hypothetical protein